MWDYDDEDFVMAGSPEPISLRAGAVILGIVVLGFFIWLENFA